MGHPMNLMGMMERIRKLLEMIRFSHTIFALPFALLAAVMAWIAPATRAPVRFNWLHLLAIVICMVAARSAAMAFNRLADRQIDAENPRTSARHLPAGTLTVSTVVAFTLVASLVFIAGTMFFLPNWLPLGLSVPLLLVLFGYSFAKRFTALAHFWLGLALMLAPVCAWIALRGMEVIAVPTDLAPALVLGLSILFWVAGLDIIYACQDVEFDRRANLKSIPVALGVAGALRLASVCHAMMVGLLASLPFLHIWVGPKLDLGWLYGLTLAALAILLFYEHAIVRPNDLTRVNVAFFNVNAVVSISLFVLTTIDLLVV